MEEGLERYLVSVDSDSTDIVADKLREMDINVEETYELINLLIISIHSYKFERVSNIPEVLFLEKERSIYL